jgi:pimeloyl-ACP methyl ester carboxylesterase
MLQRNKEAVMLAKPPLLFLHGAFTGPEIWTEFFVPWFSERGYRVAAPRLPKRIDGPARLRDQVRAARAAAEAFGERPVAIGYSMGGLVAQHLAAQGRLRGAVLVASPGPMGLGPSLWHLALLSPDVLRMLLATQAGAGALLGRNALRRALFTDETPAEWIDRIMPTPEPEDPRALVDGLCLDLPFWPLARMTPMLAVLGDQDRFIPMTDLWALAFAYGAEIEVIRGAAHGLPIDTHWKSLAWRIAAWMDERLAASALPDRIKPAA